MSDGVARTHTHSSNRLKHREGAEKKAVYKAVLDNPYRIQWPSVPINTQNAALANIISLLDGVSIYHRTRTRANKKVKRSASHQESERANKRQKKLCDEESIYTPGEESIIPENITVNCSDSSEPPSPPPIFRHITFGINEVTKRLEAQAHRARRHFITTDAQDAQKTPANIHFVFACRADVNPSLLLDHIPYLIAAYNSTRPKEPIMLITFPKGAESALAQAIGVRRAAVIALDINCPGTSGLMGLLGSVPVLSSTWLSPIELAPILVPTHVKQIRTSAPKDMKVSKEARLEGRKAAKTRKQKKSQLNPC